MIHSRVMFHDLKPNNRIHHCAAVDSVEAATVATRNAATAAASDEADVDVDVDTDAFVRQYC